MFDRKTDIVNNAVAWSKVSFNRKPRILLFLHFEASVELKKAEAKCTEYKNADGHDGHLVSIHTDEEANFVSSLIRGDGDEQVYWIGLRMNCPTCEFEWTDQSSFNYANWQDGEPNNSEGKGFSERKIVVCSRKVRLSLSRSGKLRSHQSQRE